MPTGAVVAGNVFISYRRDDSHGVAGRLYDRLSSHFSSDKIFMDVDGIPAGQDFVEVLDEKVAACDVFLAVIGKDWLEAADENGNRRLDNANDFVRIEIESALNRDVLVIPVLADRAEMPKQDELPESMRALARRNAVRLAHERFGDDCDKLIQAVNFGLVAVAAAQVNRLASGPRDYRPVWIMGALGILAGLGSAIIPFDLFRFSFEKGFFPGGGELVDVVQHPAYLLTSLFFAFVVGYGAYTWGKRAWWVPLYAGAIYCLFAVASRYLFAPIAQEQSTGKFLHAVNLETLTSIFVGNPPLSNPNATFLIAVLFMAILSGGLTGVGSVVSGPLDARTNVVLSQIIRGAAIGSSTAFAFLGFLMYRQWVCPGCTGYNDGVASFGDVVVTVVLNSLWYGMLAANVGFGYGNYVPGRIWKLTSVDDV